MSNDPRVAYFSMEIALEPNIPTYSGGLGVLAGDTLRSCADLGLPMVGVTLLHRNGYLRQRIDAEGRQTEEPETWPVADLVEALDARATITIEGRSVALRAWRFKIPGHGGALLPVYLLDTDLPENAPEDRRLTDQLYGGDLRYRLCQEAVLGIGGVRILEALGHGQLRRFHMNEGHAALAVLPLIEQQRPPGPIGAGDPGLNRLRNTCVFTTHTPVPAGHDQFPMDLVRRVLGPNETLQLEKLGQNDRLNMTDLALRCSRFVNGVAMRHGEVSSHMFPNYPIGSITNGIHPATWASPPFRALFDRHIPDWRKDAFSLRYAVGIRRAEIAKAHAEAKRTLIQYVNRSSPKPFAEEALTIGFARRATAYKRAMLIFQDTDRLARIAEANGPIQLVFAGKAHPADLEGKALIENIWQAGRQLDGRIVVTYLENYEVSLAQILVAGCDVWMNTPLAPLEASGTSGMKAALNGVPSLSIIDGWWVEGHVEGVTGWAIGTDEAKGGTPSPGTNEEHAEALYQKLEHSVLPCFYKDPDEWQQIMRYSIALNASFFNTQRMALQYVNQAYRGTTQL